MEPSKAIVFPRGASSPLPRGPNPEISYFNAACVRVRTSHLEMAGSASAGAEVWTPWGPWGANAGMWSLAAS